VIDYPGVLIAAEALQRARGRVKPSTPAALAVRILNDFKVLPTTALISDVILDAIVNADRRYVLSTPPRLGKSQLASVAAPIFALMLDHDAMVVVKSYGDQLAEEHSGQMRRLIAEHSDLLGFSVDQSKSAVDRWLVAGHRGGVLAGGVGSPAVGFGVSSTGLLVVDDPIKGSAEADSPAHRRRLLNSVRADLLSRLHPSASCVVIASRWHPADLAGELLAEEDSPWRHINVPAVATAGVRDDLHREPGQAVSNPLGYTASDFARVRRSVGSRVWNASYLGTPAAPEGSLIMAEWIDSHRLPAAPSRPSRIVVAVDPADSGHGDQTGIIAASLTPDGTVALIADASGHMTSDAWARKAVELAIALGSSSIVLEGFSAATTYLRLVTDAVRNSRSPHRIAVSTWPERGRARVGDSVARSQGLIAALENGRCVVAGQLSDLESDMTSWQAHAHQPDRVASAVIAYTVLSESAGRGMTIASPLDAGRRRGNPAIATWLGSGGRPEIDEMVAVAAARKRALANGTDPDQAPEYQRAVQHAHRSAWMSRRLD
jgi:hypothetical protein